MQLGERGGGRGGRDERAAAVLVGRALLRLHVAVYRGRLGIARGVVAAIVLPEAVVSFEG